MAAAHQDVQRLAGQAAQALHLRPLLELASGFGVGLLALGSRVANRTETAGAELLFVLLVVLPVLHSMVMLVYVALLRSVLERYFTSVLGDPAALLPLLSASEQQRSFRQRLRQTLADWRRYLRQLGSDPMPRHPVVAYAGLLLAALYAVLAIVTQGAQQWHPLFAPLLFPVLVLHFYGLKLAVAGDVFARCLLERLTEQSDED